MSIHFREQRDFVRILELTPALRRRIEATVEHLIGLLDAYDGESDMEDADIDEDNGDDEPSLGADERVMQLSWALPTGSRERTDVEDENEHGGDVLDEPHDAEPDEEDDWRDHPVA